MHKNNKISLLWQLSCSSKIKLCVVLLGKLLSMQFQSVKSRWVFHMKWSIRPGDVHLVIPFSYLLSHRTLLIICMAHISLGPAATKYDTQHLSLGIRRSTDLVSSPRTSDCKLHKLALGILKRNISLKEKSEFQQTSVWDWGKRCRDQNFPRVYNLLTSFWLWWKTRAVENFLLPSQLTYRSKQKAFARVSWSSQAKLEDPSQEKGKKSQEVVLKRAWRANSTEESLRQGAERDWFQWGMKRNTDLYLDMLVIFERILLFVWAVLR